MPRLLQKLSLALVALGLVAALSAASATAKAPYVKTEAASSITGTTAVLNATVYSQSEISKYWYYPETLWVFEYGTTTAYGQASEPGFFPAHEGYALGGLVNAKIFGLAQATKYHFRIVAVNGETGEKAYGSDMSFETLGGIYLTGEKSEVESQQPAITATSFPRSLFTASESETKLEWVTSGASIACTAKESTAGTIYKSIKLFTAAGQGFEGCNLSTTISMNGCQLVYEVANAGPPYTGPVRINCIGEQPIEIQIKGIECTLKIGPQTISEGVTYEEANPISGTLAVRAKTNAKGVTFTKTGSGCIFVTGTTETIKGNITLYSH